MDGRYIPEHTPWEFEDAFAPMPWIPEGSLVSKSRFHEVRREQRPGPSSPPPTPPAARDVLPLDVLPFPAIVPSSTDGPTLRRAATFHPGGSQRLRREALVIDGKVTIDTGFKLRSRSLESIASSSFQPNNMDLVIRQLDSGHESGLERLKKSMLWLMKAQSHRNYPEVANRREQPELYPSMSRGKAEDKIAERTPHDLLAVRRGQPVPSSLKLGSTRYSPPVSPYRPDVPTPFRGSPSAATPLITGFLPGSEADKRESINIEDMCTNLRHLVSPIAPNSGKEETSPSQIGCSVVGPVDVPDGAVGEAPRTPAEDWNFASELEGMYGDDPFLYFDPQERMPSFVRPLSITPDVVMESTGMKQSSGSSATSVSAFPEPPTETPSVPYIAISEDGPVSERPSSPTWSSLRSSATDSNEDLSDSVDSIEVPSRATVSSTKTSPRSSEDRDEPLAIRRLTLLARSSVAMLKAEDFSSSGNFFSLAGETSKPTTKIVRFASEPEQPNSLGDQEATSPPCGHQRPRSSSAPPPQKSSFRNQTFLQREECKHDRLSRSQPATLPSRIPKKSPFTRIGTHDQHPVTRNASPPARLDNANKDKKQLSSLIPIVGLKASYALFPLNHEKADDERQAIGHNSRLYVSPKQPSRTPTPQSAQPQQKSLLSTSWSMTLRQYVKGGDPSGEKRKISPSQSPGPRGELNPNPSVGTKSLLPVKKASLFRDGVAKVTSLNGAHGRTGGRGQAVDRSDGSEGSIVGSVDKTGGISYIAPPKVRETRSRLQGRAKGERQGPPTAGTRTLRPGQIRNLLGRFAA